MWPAVNNLQAAMAENLAPTHIPTDQLIKAYEEWSEGNWGMVMTGKKIGIQSAVCVLDIVVY